MRQGGYSHPINRLITVAAQHLTRSSPPASPCPAHSPNFEPTTTSEAQPLRRNRPIHQAPDRQQHHSFAQPIKTSIRQSLSTSSRELHQHSIPSPITLRKARRILLLQFETAHPTIRNPSSQLHRAVFFPFIRKTTPPPNSRDKQSREAHCFYDSDQIDLPLINHRLRIEDRAWQRSA